MIRKGSAMLLLGGVVLYGLVMVAVVAIGRAAALDRPWEAERRVPVMFDR